MKRSAKVRLTRPFIFAASASAMLAVLSNCSAFEERNRVRVAAIGDLTPDPQLARGPVSNSTLIVFDATAQGLISFDGAGQIEPALAERWTVTTDGRSYIFRIREAEWPDGSRVTAQHVVDILRSYIAPRSRHPLAKDFVEVQQIHAMTDMVVEIRLSVPQPYILELLAQPSMAIVRRTKGLNKGWGPMRATANGKTLSFTPIPDPMANDEDEEEAPRKQSIEMVPTSATGALARFKNGYADVVLGGTFQEIPYFKASGISRQRLLIDPASGIFGLAFANANGFWASADHRSAIAALIRPARTVEGFGFTGWLPQETLRPAPRTESSAPTPILPTWLIRSEADRVTTAARLVSEWRADGKALPPVRIALPEGLGSKILFAYIASDLRRAGLEAIQVAASAPADLRLIDEVAPNDDPIWALRRLNCRADTLCSDDIRTLLGRANAHGDAADRFPILQQAEAQMMAFMPFIPIAQPLRWSVGEQRITGLAPNIRAHHPLNRLLTAPK